MLDQEIIYVQFVQQNEWYCFHLKVNCIALHCIPIELHFIVLCSLALAILSFWSGWRETKPSYYYFGKSNSSREISVYIHHHSISIRYRSKRWSMSSVIWIVKILQKEFCLRKQLKISFVNYNSALSQKESSKDSGKSSWARNVEKTSERKCRCTESQLICFHVFNKYKYNFWSEYTKKMEMQVLICSHVFNLKIDNVSLQKYFWLFLYFSSEGYVWWNP